MSASNPEVVVDHASDLFSAKESILFLSFLFLQTDLLLDGGILDDLDQSGSNLRVQHLKNVQNSFQKRIAKTSIPLVNQSTISTSLIHNIASEGEPEQALTWVLNLNFQHEKRWKCEEFVKLKLRDLKSLLISHVILWICSYCWKERIPGRRFPCKSRRWKSISISFFTSSDKSPCAISYWVSACSTLIPGVKHSSVRCRGWIDWCKWTVKNVSPCTKHQAAGFGRGSANHEDLEQLSVDWERGIIFHWTLIRHLGIL